MPPMMNVLIVRTSSMGDLIHTWPAITELVAHYPNLKISWLAEENFAQIAALHPAVSHVITLSWRRWRRNLLSMSTWKEILALRKQLRATKWDLVIDSQGLLKSAIPARSAGGPLAGYSWKSIREPLASLLYNKCYVVDSSLSAVERNRQLFSRVFGYVSSGEAKFGITRTERPGWLPTEPYVALLHATSRSSKEWPEASWIALGRQLYQERGWISVLPWGNGLEQARAQRLASAIPGAIVAPRLELSTAANMLGYSAAVIGVDTGLTHLANALDVPLVALYTDTDPILTGVIETSYAVNLGGIGQQPDLNQVLTALTSRKGVA
jgi:heptosyltransferase-1